MSPPRGIHSFFRLLPQQRDVSEGAEERSFRAARSG